jgi:hypothetical protein
VKIAQLHRQSAVRGTAVVLAVALVGCLPSYEDSGADGGTEAGTAALVDSTVPDVMTGEGGGHEAGEVGEGGRVAEAGSPTDAAPTDAAPNDASDAQSCVSACNVGLTRCAGGGVLLCQVVADGGGTWVQIATCGAHQTCTSTTGMASCGCTATVCAEAGTSCQDSQTVATCAMDSDSCFYVASTSSCASPESCSRLAPNATCSLTCFDSCSPGQKSCVSGGLAVCILGSNGCYSYSAPTMCGPNQICTGSAGSGACT